jgi:hypothetical protein
VLPENRREVTTSIVTAALVAILYRYWFVTPVLQFITIGQWRIAAIVVAIAFGGVLSLLRLSRITLVCVSLAGLLLGGTWAAWQAHNDLRVSIGGAFASHVESFWREVIILTVAASIGAFCCSRLISHR